VPLQKEQGLFLVLFAYGTLCRFQETAKSFPAVSWSGVWQITNKKLLRNNLYF